MRADYYVVRRDTKTDDDGWEVYAGRIEPGGAWWDVPLPACPDCGGTMQWVEAHRVPGARLCAGCGSWFQVSMKSWGVSVARARFYTRLEGELDETA